MSGSRVSHTVVEMIVNTADGAGVTLGELCAGLPVTERELRHRASDLEWDVAVELFERLEEKIGRARLDDLVSHIEHVSPIGQRVFGRFVSVPLLMRFACQLVGPAMYPMYEVSWEAAERDGALVGHLSLRLKPGLRGCSVLFRLHGIATAALPRMIGHPPVPVRSETSDRGGDYWFTLREAPAQ